MPGVRVPRNAILLAITWRFIAPAIAVAQPPVYLFMPGNAGCANAAIPDRNLIACPTGAPGQCPTGNIEVWWSEWRTCGSSGSVNWKRWKRSGNILVVGDAGSGMKAKRQNKSRGRCALAIMAY